MAVLLSVTAVLIFGEVLPTAYFTGPDQVRIASGCWHVHVRDVHLQKACNLIIDLGIGSVLLAPNPSSRTHQSHLHSRISTSATFICEM
eukprot:630460-Amphidinium_carterae.1